MKLRNVTTFAIAAATAAIAIPSPALAEPTARSVSRRADTSTELQPNVDLIASGLFTLAIPYVASVVVATESTRKGDNFLYTPVAGPWLDLTNRDECPPTGSCGNETAYKMLLVADGILQGFGALQIVSGLLFPVPASTNSSSSSPQVRVVPNVARTSAGISAVGTF